MYSLSSDKPNYVIHRASRHDVGTEIESKTTSKTAVKISRLEGKGLKAARREEKEGGKGSAKMAT